MASFYLILFRCKMFHLSLFLDDCQIRPQVFNSKLTWEKSSLILFDHPAIHGGYFFNNNDCIILVYEKCGIENELLHQADIAWNRQEGVFLDDFDLVHELFDTYPGEIFLIETAAGEFSPAVRFRSSQHGICLHYFSVVGDRMEIGWSFEAVARSHPKPAFDFHYMMRSYYKPSYSHRTPFQNVNVMPRGCVLNWDANEVDLQRDTITVGIKKSDISADIEPEQRIISCIENTIKRRNLSASDVVIELSGGVDSSLVGCGLGRVLGDGIHSLGIKVHDKALSKAQTQRRSALIERYGFKDHYIAIESYPSQFRASENQLDFQLPHSEHHIEAFEKLWQEAREAGCRYMFTGFGGDELFPNFSNEPEEKILTYAFDKLVSTELDMINRSFFTCLTDHGKDLAQSALVEPAYCEGAEVSALLASQHHTHLVMKQGFWPVHPLIDPDIVQYCYNLDREQRVGKTAGRNTLSILLEDNELFDNYPKENLLSAVVFSLQLHKSAMNERIKTSPLVTYGLVDASKWSRMLEQSTREDDVISAGILAQLFGLDRFIRCYDN